MWDGTLVLQRKRKGWSLLEDTIFTTGSPSVFVCSSVLLNSLWSIIVHVCFAFTIVWSLSINLWLLITFWFGLLCFFITRPWQYRKGLSIQSTCTWMLPKDCVLCGPFLVCTFVLFRLVIALSVCTPNYGFWLSLWNRQTFLKCHSAI